MSDKKRMLCVERVGDILRVVLNRPERRNALHPEQLQELTRVVSNVPEDMKLLTLEGEGDLAFSSGFDIKVLATTADGPHPSSWLFEAATAVTQCAVPTLSVVRGFCLGAGFDLAMACDFRIGTPSARFGVPAARISTVYEPRSVDRIRRLVGPTVTKELFMLGREFDAERAARVGILQEIVEPDEIQQAVGRWVAPSREVAYAHKRMVDQLEMRHDRPEHLWAELDSLRASSVESADRKTALQRFISRPSGAST